MLFHRLLSSSLLLAILLTLAVCASPTGIQTPTRPPTVQGTVTSVRHSATASGLMVESSTGGCGMQVTIDAATQIFRRAPSGSLTLVTSGTVAEGDAVEIYADGPVLESCPMQGHAGTVVIRAPGRNRDLLTGHWIHAQEEDAGGVEVYRPSGSREFPPRMYRAQYIFRPDGRAEVFVVHPADAHHFVPGTWRRDTGRNRVVVERQGAVERFRIVELKPGLLRLRRLAT